MLYICLECGHVFDEPARWEERHGLGPFEGPGEQWSGCPCCRGGYDEAQQCDCCGEWFAASEMTINDEGNMRLCPDCAEQYDSDEDLTEGTTTDPDVQAALERRAREEANYDATHQS